MQSKALLTSEALCTLYHHYDLSQSFPCANPPRAARCSALRSCRTRWRLAAAHRGLAEPVLVEHRAASVACHLLAGFSGWLLTRCRLRSTGLLAAGQARSKMHKSLLAAGRSRKPQETRACRLAAILGRARQTSLLLSPTLSPVEGRMGRRVLLFGSSLLTCRNVVSCAPCGTS